MHCIKMEQQKMKLECFSLFQLLIICIWHFEYALYVRKDCSQCNNWRRSMLFITACLNLLSACGTVVSMLEYFRALTVIQVLSTVNIKILAFWDVMSYALVDTDVLEEYLASSGWPGDSIHNAKGCNLMILFFRHFPWYPFLAIKWKMHWAGYDRVPDLCAMPLWHLQG